jgi:hypothetical protein
MRTPSRESIITAYNAIVRERGGVPVDKGVLLGIPVILAGLASGLAWRGKAGWLAVSVVCFYAMAFLQQISIGAA